MNRYIDNDGRSSLKTIRQNEAHFRLCNKCRSINYYRNKLCVLCNSDNLDRSYEYDSNTFKDIIKEYNFYTDKGFETVDIDNIKLTTISTKEEIRNRDKDFKYNKYLFKLKDTTKL